MRGERKIWTFVKQIIVVHSNGPRRRPRVDLGEVHDEVHLWTSHKVTSVDPKKILFFENKSVALEGFEPKSLAWKSSA